MYKVFINDKAVVFLPNTIDNFQSYSDLELIKSENATPKYLYSITLADKVKGVGIIVEGNVESAFKNWCKLFEWVDAAGGVVINNSGEFLGIKRLGKWDLPKGKADEGETIESTALREVEEECGIKGLSISRFMLNTYHIYPHKQHFALKCTRWYLMSWDGQGDLKPQLDEGIEAVKWFEKKAKPEFESNTYSSIKEVLNLIE